MAPGSAAGLVPPDCPLTPRQFDVVQLLAKGWSPLSVAVQLGLKRSSVYSYVMQACRRMGLPHRTALLAEAGRRGWTGWSEFEAPAPLAVEHPWLGAYLAELDEFLASGARDQQARERMRLALAGHRHRQSK